MEVTLKFTRQSTKLIKNSMRYLNIHNYFSEYTEVNVILRLFSLGV